MNSFLRAVEASRLREHDESISTVRGSALPKGVDLRGDATSEAGIASRAQAMAERQERIAAMRRRGAASVEIMEATGLTLRQLAYAEKQARRAESSLSRVVR